MPSRATRGTPPAGLAPTFSDAAAAAGPPALARAQDPAPAPAPVKPAPAHPATIPPADIPPATIPPATIPPADIPPADIPPADIPPADIPPADMEPAAAPTSAFPAEPASADPASADPASADPASADPASADPAPGSADPAPAAASPVRRPRTGRRDDLLQAAARLFAERGFRGVGIEQIGAAVGIRGPGIYRHFASKDAMLTELLVGISEHLLHGAQTVLSADPSAFDALDHLVRRHVEFAVGNPDLIVIHDRDLHSLPAPDEHEVRRLQRAYVELWVGVLRRLRPELTGPAARVRAHAIFGLINSTPHSSGVLDPAVRATTLHAMATAAAAA
ncbi:TetR/AcrR family transcriptional regulator [Frankia sp. QA3]|uniref:TetR/AcrR family transcriptional regulator n=1 Tax=Frankia sp. QA3 TaxID=710111 RepID=UPI000300513E|nr:TetR/AcrR family transcriptional regulator [Frankia sp. QA3]